MVVWKYLFYIISIWDSVVVMKVQICKKIQLGRVGGIERTDFEQFPHWAGVVFFKGYILSVCGECERTGLQKLSTFWNVILKELICDNFYLRRM